MVVSVVLSVLGGGIVRRVLLFMVVMMVMMIMSMMSMSVRLMSVSGLSVGSVSPVRRGIGMMEVVLVPESRMPIPVPSIIRVSNIMDTGRSP